MQEFGFAPTDAASARLSRQVIERVLTACGEFKGSELDRLVALLRRYEAEAALEDAQDATAAMIAPDAPQVVVEVPLLLEDGSVETGYPAVPEWFPEFEDATAGMLPEEPPVLPGDNLEPQDEPQPHQGFALAA